MGVARLYAALAHGEGDARRWATIETEFHRTVAMLRRITGRDRLLDEAPVLQRSIALRNPVRRLAVRAPGAPAGPAPRAAA